MTTLQITVAAGCLALSAVLMMMSTTSLTTAAIKEDFHEFSYHPGPHGQRHIAFQFSLGVLLGVLAFLYGATWFRWLTAGFVGLATLFMIGHQIGHLVQDRRWPPVATTALDFTHHIVGVLITIQAIRWAAG